jgi:pimeloyl-ACP methyl ester carboxylesterase
MDVSFTTDGTAYQFHPARAFAGGDAAPVIVLIHGLGLTMGTWDDHIEELSLDHRVLRYDLAGHGKSTAPHRTPDLTLYSDQLASLLDALAIAQCAVVGFSLGGMINRRFAMDYPDRVSALAILNSPHERGDEAQALVEQRARDTHKGGPGATLDATIERWFTPSFIAENVATIARVRGWVLANDTDIYTACRMVLATGVIELIRPSPPIAHPSIVITCANDTGSTPSMTEAIAAEIAGARAVIIPQLQHMGLMEKPALFTTPILAFLAEVRK